MKKAIIAAICCAFIALAAISCGSLDPEKDYEGTPYGFWIVDSLNVEVSTTVNGNTTKHSSNTDFTRDYCRLSLDTLHIATLWYNFDLDIETFSYVESTKRITFKEGLNAGDDGKAIVLLGVYDVELSDNSMVMRQPEASISGTIFGASERATYYFHRAPKSEKPKDSK